MDIIIERPTLNKDTSRRNLAVVDSWIADTADKLNAFFTAYKKTSAQSETFASKEAAGRNGIYPGDILKETSVIAIGVPE